MKLPFPLVFITFLTCFLGACSPSPTSAPVAPPATAMDDRLLVLEAQDNYRAGNFDTAFRLSQQAIQSAPHDATAWEIMRKAAIAQSGDEYLRRLPDHRYRISPQAFLADKANGKGYFLVDVREPTEYEINHISGAINIPLRELLRHLDELPSISTPILLYCHSQKSATHALVILRELGYNQVYNLEGGFAAYMQYITNHPLPTPGPTPTIDPAKDPDHDGGC